VLCLNFLDNLHLPFQLFIYKNYLMSKKNIFNKKVSNLVISITKRIESFFNFLSYSIFNKKKYSSFWKKSLDKKIFIVSAIMFFGVITYFLLPSFYNKNEVKKLLKSQILEKYNLEVKLDKDLKYGLFPTPHFFIEEAQIEYKNKSISTSNNTRFYISSKNNLTFNEINLNDIVFFETDFTIDKSNFSFFSNLSKINALNKNIKFSKNKLFYLDQNRDVVFFSDIKKIDYIYQENSQNLIESKLNIFNLPVKLKSKHIITDKVVNTEIDLNTLRLKIENNLKYNEDTLEGLIELNYINKNQKIKYNIKNDKIILNSIDRKFSGEINIKPFFLLLNLNLQNIGVKKIFANNSILINFLKSEIIYNKNLNGKIKIKIDGLNDLNHIDQIIFDIQLDEGLISISNLNFIFKNSTILNFNNVSMINDENKLMFIGDMEITFKDIQNFYSHFQIIRNFRKNIKKITSNFVFNFDDELFQFNDLKIAGIDQKISDQYLNKFNSEKNDIFNKVIFRNTVKDFFKTISSD